MPIDPVRYRIMDYQFEPDAQYRIYTLPDGTILAEFVTGYEFEAGTIVYMQILLVNGESYLHNELMAVYDLQFGIREKLSNDNNVLTSIDFSYLSPGRFIPRAARPAISEWLKGCVRELVVRHSPGHITMETYHPRVPPGAMAKYDRIAELLQSHDYDLLEHFRGTMDGKDYWYFRKKTTGPRAIRKLEKLNRYIKRATHWVLERTPP